MVSYNNKLARWAPSGHCNRWLLAACVVLFVILVVLLPLGTRFTRTFAIELSKRSTIASKARSNCSRCRCRYSLSLR